MTQIFNKKILKKINDEIELYKNSNIPLLENYKYVFIKKKKKGSFKEEEFDYMKGM